MQMAPVRQPDMHGFRVRCVADGHGLDTHFVAGECGYDFTAIGDQDLRLPYAAAFNR